MAEQKILVNLNLNGNTIYNANVHSGPSEPSVTEQDIGRLFYNTTSKTLKIWSGEAWIAASGEITDTITIVTESTENGKIKVQVGDNEPTDVPIHGLANAAYAGTTTTISAGDTSNVPFANAVVDYVNNRLTSSMTYKGTITSTQGLPTENVKIGDTYKVAEIGTYSGQSAKIGDMFIAKSETPEWDYIPSGDDGDAIVFTETNPQLIATTGGVCEWTVTHNLGKQFPNVSIAETSSQELVIAKVKYISTTQLKVTINSSSNIDAGFYTITCVG